MSREKKETKEILSDLDEAEGDVLEIMRLAEETVAELSRLPNVDASKLESMAIAYLDTVRRVQEKLKEHSVVIQPYKAQAGDSNYLLKKEVELKEASEMLEQEMREDS